VLFLEENGFFDHSAASEEGLVAPRKRPRMLPGDCP